MRTALQNACNYDYFCKCLRHFGPKWSSNWSWSLAACGVVVLTLTYVVLRNRRSTKRALWLDVCAQTCLWEYLAFIAIAIVFSRKTAAEARYEPRFLYSYFEFFQGNRRFFWLTIFNVALFVPLGFFYSACERFRKVGAWRAWLYPLAVSLTIETVQLVFRKGVFEWDDVFHNVIGFVLGYWVFRFGYQGVRRLFYARSRTDETRGGSDDKAACRSGAVDGVSNN